MKLLVVEITPNFSLAPYLAERLQGHSVYREQHVQNEYMWKYVKTLCPDVIFVDFCDENAVVLSKRLGELPKKPRLIVRLHRYEAQDQYLKRVFWPNVSDLIVVSPKFEEIVGAKMAKLCPEVRLHLIPNGVDLTKFQLQDEASMDDSTVAYVGYLNKKKGPALLRAVMASLADRQFHVGGTFQDEEIELYFRDLELPNVRYFGWVRTEEFLRGKRFIISTSVTESFGMGVAEAMAMGLTPLVHAWPGADTIWPRECLWNTFEELGAIKPKDPAWCREWVETRYSMGRCIDKFVNLLEGPP